MAVLLTVPLIVISPDALALRSARNALSLRAGLEDLILEECVNTTQAGKSDYWLDVKGGGKRGLGCFAKNCRFDRSEIIAFSKIRKSFQSSWGIIASVKAWKYRILANINTAIGLGLRKGRRQ